MALLATSCFSPEVPADTEGGTGDPTTGESSGPSSGPSTETSGPTTTNPTTSSTETTTGPTTGTGPTDDATATETDPTQGDSSGTGTGLNCGNGEVDGDEECDDGTNDGAYGGCNGDCTLAPYCGDGEQNGAEDCDDGDEVNGNGCNVNCLESGQELWTHEVHVGQNDRCRVVRADGDQIFLGGSIPNAIGDSENLYWAQRLSGAGDVVWTTDYGPYTAATEDYDLIGGGLDDGEFVLAGYLQLRGGLDEFSSFAAFSRDDGAVAWDRNDKFGAPNAGAVAFAGLPDQPGGVGAAWPNDRPSHIVSISGTGTTGTSEDPVGAVTSLAMFGNGGVASGELVNGDDATVVARNAGFGVLWQQPLEGLQDISSVATTVDAEVYAAGGYDVLSTSTGTGWLAKLDSDGNEAWRRSAGDIGADVYAVVAAPDGAAFAAGRMGGGPWLGRISADGVLQWEVSGTGSGELVSISTAAGGDGPFVVACGVAEAGGADGDNILAITVTP